MLAELVNQHRRMGLRRVGLEKIVRARQNVVDAGPSRMNQQGCSDPVPRPGAGEYKALLDMVGVTFPCSYARRRLLCGIIEQPAHLLGVQTRRAARRRRGAETSEHTVGVLHRASVAP